MEEFWKVIDEAPDYQVSSHGRVRRIRPDYFGRMGPACLAMPLNDRGYKNLNLHIGRKQCLRRVHTLVCTAFHGPKPSDRHQVRHLDGDKLNNADWNLAWGTDAENKADSVRLGTSARPGVSKARIGQELADILRRSDESQTKLSKRYGISRAAISKIRAGKTYAKAA